ncbi:hypothetical protein CONPUDRAFT_163195 [Coniophora puteana RWD-64-598 SS2]|uniref:Uncharacterized protein n=1 Tax=Coniophora puteana (strain RWD-64-598) TaxID=741705 RepID=A0A5M3MY27_CONPW|nr:uncharacterized protein CONPUDRAFT_163195 [Coniophora puteana RWD-64-598 SS2]EIW83936.1 hypothetical protein CONPUDRAFT_163195 [Coniophora puteana RWD-64-598 SS2]
MHFFSKSSKSSKSDKDDKDDNEDTPVAPSTQPDGNNDHTQHPIDGLPTVNGANGTTPPMSPQLESPRPVGVQLHDDPVHMRPASDVGSAEGGSAVSPTTSTGKRGSRLSRSYAASQRESNATKTNGTASPPSSPKPQPNGTDHDLARAPSLRSLPAEDDNAGNTALGSGGTAPSGFGFGNPRANNGTGGHTSKLSKRGSVRSRRSMRSTGTTGSVATAAFSNGAALSGPNAEPDIDEDVRFRGANAERSLSQKVKRKISKDERKEAKRFSKLLAKESTSEKAALATALSTLASLQALHKAAQKRESKASADYAKALAVSQAAESKYHEERARQADIKARADARVAEERARWEGRLAQVQAQEERAQAEMETMREMEDRLAECAREVERLRIIKGTDERERQARMIELKGKK